MCTSTLEDLTHTDSSSNKDLFLPNLDNFSSSTGNVDSQVAVDEVALAGQDTLAAAVVDQPIVNQQDVNKNDHTQVNANAKVAVDKDDYSAGQDIDAAPVVDQPVVDSQNVNGIENAQDIDAASIVDVNQVMANNNGVIDNQGDQFQWGPHIDELLQMDDPFNPHDVFSFGTLSFGSITETAKV